MQTQGIERESVDVAIDELCAQYISSSLQDFKELKKLVTSSAGEDVQEAFSKKSTELRNLLSGFVRDIDEIMKGDESAEDLLDLFIEIDRIWWMCEIFALNPSSNSFLSLEVASWLRSGDCPIFMEQIGKSILTMDRPELYDESRNGGIDYWSAVYSFTLQGDLRDCWELLSIHSYINNASSRHRSWDRTRSEAKHQEATNPAYLLEEILTTHPYAPHALADTGNLSSASNSSQISAGLHAWKDRVRTFKTMGAALLGRIPELGNLIRILEGDTAVIRDAAAGQWTRVALADLLYVHAPPLSRANVCKVIQNAMKTTQAENQTNQSVSRWESCLQSLMAGQVGPAVRCMYDSGVGAHLGRSMAHIPAMLANAFLCHCLVHGAGIVELCEIAAPDVHAEVMSTYKEFGDGNDALAVVKKMASTTSYYEQILVEICIEIHDRALPLDVLDGFIDICPTLAAPLATSLFSMVPVLEDTDTHKIADLLSNRSKTMPNLNPEEEERLVKASKAVCTSRGRYWEDKYRSEIREGQVRSNLLSRCIYFYWRGEEYKRIAALIEQCWQRCMQAVLSLDSFFSDLPKTHFVSNQSHLDPDSVLQPAAVSSMSYFDATFGEAAAFLVQIPSLEGNFPTTSDTATSSSSLQRGDPTINTVDRVDAKSLHKCLTNYTRGLQTYMGWTNELNNLSIQSILQTASSIGFLVTEEIAPIRYWLHLISLSLWFHNKYHNEMLKKKNSCDAISENEKITDSYDGSTTSGSKDEAYMLIQALERVVSSPDFSFAANSEKLGEACMKVLRQQALEHLNRCCMRENKSLLDEEAVAHEDCDGIVTTVNDLLSGHSFF